MRLRSPRALGRSLAVAAAATVGLSIALSIAPATLRTAEAAPQDLFGFGARSSSMGMTAAASSEGYEAIYGNPGLLAGTRTKTLTLGLGVARHALSADTADRSMTLPTDEMKTIYIGAALPIPFGGVLKDRVTFGVGFLNPAKYLVRGKILYPERNQYPIVAPRVQSIAVMMGLGMRIGERFYVGAGFEALAGVVGEILISLDATGRVGARTDDQVIAAYAPIASFAIDLGTKWRAGLTYRGELIGRFALKIRVQDLGINLPDFNVAGIAQYIPEQLALEGRWSSSGNGPSAPNATGTRVAAGLLFRRWSAFPGPNEPTVLANTEFGTGSPGIGASDTVSPRIGFEHMIRLGAGAQASGFRFRAGYALEPTPLPKQTRKENLLDSTRHVITAGLGVVLSDSVPIQLDVFAQLHALASRKHEKDAEAKAAGAQDITSGGTIWVIGLTTGVRF